MKRKSLLLGGRVGGDCDFVRSRSAYAKNVMKVGADNSLSLVGK